MADLRVVKVAWTGLTGLPGVSVFHTSSADDATANLGTWFTAIKAYFPTGLQWTIPSSGDTISDLDGTLTGGWSGGTAASVIATGGGFYAAGTGAFIRWGTGLIVGGRRLKGRTFLCPITTGSYDADGTIAAATITAVNTATNTLVATNKLVVWHRPSVSGASDGASTTITSGAIADQVTSLKTRRV